LGAQEQGAAAIEKKLASEYSLTKTTDDKTDIVTAGAVLVLQKDKLVMVTSDAQANQCPNFYKDGKLSQAGSCKGAEAYKKIPLFGRALPGQDKVPNTRTFVTGEKFWVTKIDVKDAGKDKNVYMEFFSDPIKEVRYKGTLAISFKGNNLPSPDDALKLVGEVVTVAPSEDAKDNKDKPAQGGQQQAAAPQQQQAAPAPAPAAPAPAADAPPAPIEPPPPPPVETPPPTVSEGQTPDQVVAILGQPQKKAKVGTKETYFYKDLKVVFVNGKVKDVQ
jgi:hypothetical protein